MRMRTRRKSKKNYNKNRIIIISSIIFVILLFFSVIFSLININNTKILKGIKIQNVDVANLNEDEARKRLNDWYENCIKKDITATYQDMEETIIVDEINPEIDIDKLIKEAQKIGRTGNIVKDNYQILLTILFGKNINGEITYNEEEIDKKVSKLSSKLPNAVVESNYYIEDNNLIIKKGQSGIAIKKDEFKESLKEIIQRDGEKVVEIPTTTVEPKKIDIGNIYKEIHKEAQNAYMETNPTKVHSEINGVDFAITIDEAKKMLEEEKEEYSIPLKITIPEITLEKLGTEVFPNKLSEFTTRYDASNKNRSNNLELSSNKINGTIVLPGETFSYNKTVGERTISAGYKEAAVYYNGKVVQGIGGGICQLSSTLYNAVLYANLEITSRSNHRFLTSYVKEGRDATVSWGTIDFCFKNTRNYPIKIESTAQNGIVKIAIYGIKEENEYEVELETNVIETIPYTTNYINDNTLDEGTEIITQYGINGAKAETYKILKLNGAVVSKTLLSKDTYSTLEQIVKRGTKKVAATSTMPENQ